jgi:hypothetical protein
VQCWVEVLIRQVFEVILAGIGDVVGRVVLTMKYK